MKNILGADSEFIDSLHRMECETAFKVLDIFIKKFEGKNTMETNLIREALETIKVLAEEGNKYVLLDSEPINVFEDKIVEIINGYFLFNYIHSEDAKESMNRISSRIKSW